MDEFRIQFRQVIKVEDGLKKSWRRLMQKRLSSIARSKNLFSVCTSAVYERKLHLLVHCVENISRLDPYHLYMHQFRNDLTFISKKCK